MYGQPSKEEIVFLKCPIFSLFPTTLHMSSDSTQHTVPQTFIFFKKKAHSLTPEVILVPKTVLFFFLKVTTAFRPPCPNLTPSPGLLLHLIPSVTFDPGLCCLARATHPSLLPSQLTLLSWPQSLLYPFLLLLLLFPPFHSWRFWTRSGRSRFSSLLEPSFFLRVWGRGDQEWGGSDGREEKANAKPGS